MVEHAKGQLNLVPPWHIRTASAYLIGGAFRHFSLLWCIKVPEVSKKSVHGIVSVKVAVVKHVSEYMETLTTMEWPLPADSNTLLMRDRKTYGQRLSPVNTGLCWSMMSSKQLGTLL